VDFKIWFILSYFNYILDADTALKIPKDKSRYFQLARSNHNALFSRSDHLPRVTMVLFYISIIYLFFGGLGAAGQE